jgi:hypothetical protein
MSTNHLVLRSVCSWIVPDLKVSPYKHKFWDLSTESSEPCSSEALVVLAWVRWLWDGDGKAALTEVLEPEVALAPIERVWEPLTVEGPVHLLFGGRPVQVSTDHLSLTTEASSFMGTCISRLTSSPRVKAHRTFDCAVVGVSV